MMKQALIMDLIENERKYNRSSQSVDTNKSLDRKFGKASGAVIS
jgi:hypothetical protein